MTFVEYKFKQSQLKAYFTAAKNDLSTARKYSDPEVRFRFSYDALIKLAITVAAFGGKRVKSRAGHHIELIEKLANALSDKAINEFGNDMRIRRNKNLYDGGVLISKKDADHFFKMVQKTFLSAEDLIDKKKRRVKLGL